ncbi:thymidylate kinase [Caldivirga sp.]|uniref:thymidylate kinase n=1 Tax=Caldivirga sp. TaxID=2080243 RepID=UPI003D0F6F9D
MARRSLICLYGPDGAGKSTLAKGLAGELGGVVSWMRGTHTFASLVARLLARFSVMRVGNRRNPYYGITVPNSLKPLWWFLEFASILPVWLLRYVLPSLRRTVVGDRGLVDFLVWVSLTTGLGFLRSIYGRATLALASRCVNVYVTAGLSIILSRRSGDEEEWIIEQLAVYNALAKALNSPTVDTSGVSIEESRGRLRGIIEEAMRKRSK